MKYLLTPQSSTPAYVRSVLMDLEEAGHTIVSEGDFDAVLVSSRTLGEVPRGKDLFDMDAGLLRIDGDPDVGVEVEEEEEEEESSLPSEAVMDQGDMSTLLELVMEAARAAAEEVIKAHMESLLGGGER